MAVWVVTYTVESWYHKPWNPGTISRGIPLGIPFTLVPYPMEWWYLIPWRSGILCRGISSCFI